MIVKDADPFRPTSIRAQAGARAEQDMAFYLRRAFGDHRANVWVFNDLRLIHEGEVAQIDHLILHAHGIFIIESKSVSGEIQILPDGQFIRHFGGAKKVGMPSPVLQAHRQADLLRRLLQAHKSELRDRKLLGLVQGGFAQCPIEVRVAISDHGIIRGEKHALEVRKADSITQDIEDRVAAHRHGAKLLNLNAKDDDGNYIFTAAELERLVRFLLDHHLPRTAGDAAATDPPRIAPSQECKPAPHSAEVPRSAREVIHLPPRSHPSASTQATSVGSTHYSCSKCQSRKLCIEYGKYGYYFKCQDCDGNTKIDTRIAGSNRHGRIRKSGLQFHLIDPANGAEHLLFVNPESPR